MRNYIAEEEERKGRKQYEQYKQEVQPKSFMDGYREMMKKTSQQTVDRYNNKAAGKIDVPEKVQTARDNYMKQNDQVKGLLYAYGKTTLDGSDADTNPTARRLQSQMEQKGLKGNDLVNQLKGARTMAKFDKKVNDGLGYKDLSSSEKLDLARNRLATLPEDQLQFVKEYQDQYSNAAKIFDPGVTRENLSSPTLKNLDEAKFGRIEDIISMFKANGQAQKMFGWTPEETKQILGDAQRVRNQEDMDALNRELAINSNNKLVGGSVNTGIALTNPGAALMSAGSWFDQDTLGFDPNAPMARALNYKTEAQNQVSENAIGDEHKFAQFLYNTGMSTIDSAEQIALFSGFGQFASLIPFFTGATTQTIQDAKERGLSDGQAFAEGFASGAAEAVTEMIPLDNFWKLTKGGKIGKEAIRAILKQTVEEGTEEALSDILNYAADQLIAGGDGKTSIDFAIKDYMANGMSKEEAEKQAYTDFIKQVVLDFAGGSISGGVMGTAGTAIGAYNTGQFQKSAQEKYAEYAKQINDSTNYGKATKAQYEEYGQNSIRAFADDVDDSTQKGKEIKAELGKLADKVSSGKKLNMDDQVRFNNLMEEAKSVTLSEDTKDYLRTVRKNEVLVPEAHRIAATGITVEQGTRQLAEAAKNGDVNQIDNIHKLMKNSTSSETRSQADSILDSFESMAKGYGVTNEQWDAIKGIDASEAYMKGIHGEKFDGVMTSAAREGYNAGKQLMVESKNVQFQQRADAQPTALAKQTFIDNSKADIDINVYEDSYLRMYRAGATGVSYEDAISAGKGAAAYSILGEESAKAIYEAGMTDRKIELSNKAFSVVNTNNKIQKGSGAFQSLSKKTTVASETLGRLTARAIGIDIIETDRIAGGDKGFYFADKSTIVVNANTPNALFHEEGEFIKFFNSDGYIRLKEAIVPAYVAINGIDKYQTALQQFRKVYGDQTINENSDEFINDLLVGLMSTDEGIKAMSDYLVKKNGVNKAQEIIGKVKDIISKVIDIIKEFITKGDLTPYQKDVFEGKIKDSQKIIDMFIEELERASENYKNYDFDGIKSEIGEGLDIIKDSEGNVEIAVSNDGSKVIINQSRATMEDTNKKLYDIMIKNGYSKEDAQHAVDTIKLQSDMLTEISSGYAEMAEALDAEPVMTLSSDVNAARQVFRAFVTNGDYDLNIDFLTICKKRQAYTQVLNDLIDADIFDKVVFDSTAIAETNDILRANDFETACLCCFVESRRLQIQKWADTFTSEWNEAVKEINPKATPFPFSVANKENGNLDFETIAKIENEFKNAPKNKSGGLDLGGGGAASKIRPLLKIAPELAHTLKPGDLLKPSVLAKMRQTEGGQKVFELIRARYGTASPKINQEFNPYNSEIADLSQAYIASINGGNINGVGAYNKKIAETMRDAIQGKEEGLNALPPEVRAAAIRFIDGYEKEGKGKRNKEHRTTQKNAKINQMAIAAYTYDVGGVRLQSFSDFLIENVMDYFQLVADMKAQGLPMHAYSKEISFARIFGMTGMKINMSLIPIVDKSVGKENAGLDKDGNYAGWGDFAHHIMMGGQSFVQSIGFKDAIALQLDPRYSKNVGTIAIGISDNHILKMLSDPLIRMVIPYHSSGMTPEYAQRMNIDYYTDYTDVQNTKVITSEIENAEYLNKGTSKVNLGKCTFEFNGETITLSGDYKFNNAVQRYNGDAKMAAEEYKAWCAADHEVLKDRKVVDHVTLMPKFEKFADNENYYKLLEDFNTYDYDNSSARQTALQMEYPDGLTEAQEIEYRQRLKDSNQFTDKEIEHYIEVAKRDLKELVSREANSRNQYHREQDAKYEETFKQVVENLKKRPKDDYVPIVRSSRNITETSTNEERYKELSKGIISIPKSNDEYLKTNPKYLDKSAWKRTELALKTLASDLGLIKDGYTNPEIDIEFSVSNNSIKESWQKESALKINEKPKRFAEMLTCLDSLIDNAILIDVNEDRYLGKEREDKTLDKFYVLVGAFENNEGINPVKLEIKKFNDGKNNKLHVSIVLNAIEKARITEVELPKRSYHTSNLTLSAFSLNDLLTIVKKDLSSNSLGKYIPAEFIDDYYLKLVEQGKIDEAQKYVDQEAENARFTVKAYHGTTAGKFTIFRTNEIDSNMGSHFGTKEVAEAFANGEFGGDKGKGSTIYSVYLKAQNPYETYDWFAQDDFYPAIEAIDLAEKIGTPEALKIRDEIMDLDPELSEIYEDRNLLEEGYLDKEKAETLYGDFRKLLELGGYDSIKYENGLELIGDEDYIIQHPEQIKLADPVTYDDDGNIIPLSKRFDSSNPDIRHSKNIDSDGNALTEEQGEFFSESDNRNDDGALKVMYHGTKEEFTIFDPLKLGGQNGTAEGYGLYFTDNPDIANAYGGNVLKGYLNIKKPARFDRKSISQNDLTKLIKATCEKEAQTLVEEGYNSVSDAIKDTWISNYIDTYSMPIEQAYKEAAKSILRMNSNDMETIREVMSGMAIRDYQSAYDFYETLTDTLGIDGFITEWEDTNTGNKSEVAVALYSNQFKNITNLKPTNNPDIRHGRDIMTDEEFALFEGTQPTIENASILEEGLKALKGKEINTRAINKIASELKTEFASTIDKKEFADMLTRAFGYLHTRDNITFNDVMSLFSEVARPVIDSATKVENADLFNEFTDYFRGKRIKLSATQLAEVKSVYGSYSDFQKAMYPLTFSLNGDTTLDSMWYSLAEQFPGLIEYDTVEGNMPLALNDLIEALRPSPTNTFGADADEVGKDLAMRIVESYLATESDAKLKKAAEQMRAANTDYRKQVRDRYREKYNKAKENLKNTLDARRVAEKQRQMDAKKKADDALLVEQWEGAKKLHETKTRYEDLIADIKAKSKDTMTTYKDRQDAKQQKRMIAEIVNDLTTRITNPTEKKHVPQSMIKPLMELLQTFNFVEPEIRYNPKTQMYEATMLDYNEKNADGKNVNHMLLLQGKTRGDVLSQFYAELDDGKGSQNQKRWQEKLGAIKDLFDKVNLDGENSDVLNMLDATMADSLADLLKRNDNQLSINNLSTEDLITVKNALRNISKAINEQNKAFTMNQDIDDTAHDIQKNGQKYRKDRSSLFIGGHNVFVMNMMSPDTYFTMLGEKGKGIYKAFQDALDKKIKYIQQSSKYMEDTLDGIDKRIIRNWSGDKAEIHTFNVADGEVKMTTAQIMSLYELSKRQQAMGHIMSGGITVEKLNVGWKKINLIQDRGIHLTVDELANIISTLTPEQMAIADAMQRYMATESAKQGNEASLRMYGFEKYLDGEYFPITTASDSVNSKNEDGNQKTLNGIERMGFTKAVAKNAGNPIVVKDIFDVFVDHTVNMATYAAYAPVIKDALRIYNYKDVEDVNGSKYYMTVKQALNACMGRSDDAGRKYFDDLIRDINGSERAKTLQTGADAFAGHYKAAAVGGNLRVVVQQPTAFVRAGVVIDPKYLAQAVPRLFTNVSRMNELKEKVPLIYWKSQGYYETNVGRSEKAIITGVDSISDKVTEASMWMAGKADDITWATLYDAAERQIKAENPGLTGEEFDKKVIDLFNKAIHETQVVDATVMKAPWLRMNDKGLKLMSSFMAEPIKSYNIALKSILQASRGEIAKKAVVYSVGVLVATDMLNALAQALVDGLRYHDDDEEYLEEVLNYWLPNFIDNVNPIGRIPFVKDMFEQLVSTLKGDNTYGKNGSGQLYEYAAASSMVNALGTLKKQIDGTYNKTNYAAYMDYTRALSQITGMPLYNMSRDAVALWNMFTPSDLNLQKNIEKPSDKYNNIITVLDKERSDEYLNEAVKKALEKNGTVKDIKSKLSSAYKQDYLEALENGDDSAEDLYNKAVRGYMAVGLSQVDAEAEVESWTDVTVGYSDLDKAIINGDGIKLATKIVMDNKDTDKILDHIYNTFGATIEYNRMKGYSSDIEDNVNKVLNMVDGSDYDELSEDQIAKAEERAEKKAKTEANAERKTKLFTAIDSGGDYKSAVDEMAKSGMEYKDIKSAITSQYKDAFVSAYKTGDRQKATQIKNRVAAVKAYCDKKSGLNIAKKYNGNYLQYELDHVDEWLK